MSGLRCVIAYEGPTRAGMDEMLTALERSGLELRNPLTGRLTRFDGDANQVDITRDELLTMLLASEEELFQLWLNDTSDVTFSNRWFGSRLCLTFHLDGLDADGHRDALAALWCSLLPVFGYVIGFVHENDGRTVDVDWSLILATDLDPPLRPHLLMRRHPGNSAGPLELWERRPR